LIAEQMQAQLTARHRVEQLKLPLTPPELDDAKRGTAWFNGLSRFDRAFWLGAANSAVPADAWAAYKRYHASGVL
jgi:hypothetical protein